MSVYDDDAKVAALTAWVVERGFPILQSHKLAAHDRGHVAALLAYFDPPAGAHILDAGCGVGAVPKLMRELRPDLRFTLLNYSHAQLVMSPPATPKVCGDFHALPFGPATFDGVMFTYSLGHGDGACLLEAARVLRPGGAVFVYDIAADDPDSFVELMGYRPHRPEEVVEAAAAAGLTVATVTDNPPSSSRDMLVLFGREVFAAHGFDRVRPVLYRFARP